MQAKLVNVTFLDQPKNYSFLSGDFLIKKGDNVVVRSSKGILFGRTTTGVFEKDVENLNDFMPVLRIANGYDRKKQTAILKKQEEIKEKLKEMTVQNNWPFKIVSTELSFDEKYLIVNFSAESYVEFKDIAKTISNEFNVRVELRQLGERDEVKIVGGIGVCGRVCCCKKYMQECHKVSLKMAKSQGISLSPTKTNGLCGRLLCCLEYENEYYVEVEKDMPKVGSMVSTPDGEGKVTLCNLITKKCQVMFAGDEKKKNEYKEYPVSELKFKKRSEIGGDQTKKNKQ